MLSAELLLKVLYWHFVPSMSTVIFTLGFMILLTRVFDVRSPRWLYWLYFVPLAKGFVALIAGVRSPPAIPRTKPIAFAITLWDPLNLISVPAAFETVLGVPSAVDQVTIGVLCLLLLVLVWRWVSLFAFYRSLRGEELHAEDAPRLFQLLDRLVEAMGTRYPKVIVSDKPYILPCLVGLFKPTIILSPELAEESSEDILEAILAHELAHLKRRDNLLHWISVVLRDSLALNPFSYGVFSRVVTAKEQDCDRIASDVTGKPKAIAEAIVYAATVTSREGKKPLPGYMSEVSESMSAGKLTSRRLNMLQASTVAKKQKIYWVKDSMVVILTLFSFFVRLYATTPYPRFFPVLQF